MLNRLLKVAGPFRRLESLRFTQNQQVRRVITAIDCSYSSKQEHQTYGSHAHKGNYDSSDPFHRNFYTGNAAATNFLSLLAAVGLYTLLSDTDLSSPTLNCGIVAVVGNDSTDASKYLIEGLTILRNRGYDSAGLASIDSKSKSLQITKYASQKTTSDSIDLVKRDIALHSGHSIGIAHTRWATHGGKTDENAHPHTDSKHRIALVHNGMFVHNKKSLSCLMHICNYCYCCDQYTNKTASFFLFPTHAIMSPPLQVLSTIALTLRR